MRSLAWRVSIFFALVSGEVTAQDAPHELSLESVAAGEGSEVDCAVTYTNRTEAEAVSGWSFGVRHEPARLQLVDAVSGAALADLNDGGGPDFLQINLFEAGWTVGAVVSFLGADAIAPGTSHEFNRATYRLTGLATGESTVVEFTDTLGDPPVVSLLVVDASSRTPDLLAGTITAVEGGVPSFAFSVESPSVEYPRASGVASFGVDVSVAEEGGPTATEGLSIALAHDSSFLSATAVEARGPVADLSNGLGPEFFGATVFSTGITLEIVYGFLGSSSLVFREPVSVARVSYETVPSAFVGVAGPVGTELEFRTLGDPPIENLVIVDGVGVEPSASDGSVTLLGMPADVEFVTGECNQDGQITLADPIYLIAFLFQGGPLSECLAACDTDGNSLIEIDDALLTLNYLYLQGVRPVEPFPDCGTRPGVTENVCSFPACSGASPSKTERLTRLGR